jgi:hypothetical protein
VGGIHCAPVTTLGDFTPLVLESHTVDLSRRTLGNTSFLLLCLPAFPYLNIHLCVISSLFCRVMLCEALVFTWVISCWVSSPTFSRSRWKTPA